MLRSLIRLIAAMSRVERLALAVLSAGLLLSCGMLLRQFYIDNTVQVPVAGGTYIEGSVGELLPLNPWFTVTNDVNRDIVSLVFSGLLRYDPASGKITEDMATMTVSSDNRIYTLTLKPDLLWHDSTKEKPHPVTADDVLYTFKTVQAAEFPNAILRQNFRGVEIEKIDARTVRFRLEKPYSFFTSNLTLGLVPQNAFADIPVDKLDQVLDFGFHPIGSGPYSFVSLLQTDLSTEVTLKRFPQKGMPDYRLERLVFRIFPDYTALLSDIINLNGVRLVPRNDKGQPIVPKRFTAMPYTLPQYVAVFFNLDREALADKQLRLGLQLATDKTAVAAVANETHIVDTPLLEIDLGDWRYKFDRAAAQGALFESNWNLPEKLRLQRVLEQRDANSVGPLKTIPPVALLETGASLVLTGALADVGHSRLYVNGILALTGSALPAGSQSGSWLVKLPTDANMSGALKIGQNIVKMTIADGDILDSAYLRRVTETQIYERAAKEQQLVDQFKRSTQMKPDDPQRLAADDLYLEAGYLRRKTDQDPPHRRVNAQGKELVLTLLTSNKPETYPLLAEKIKQQWEALGVGVKIEVPKTRKDFEQRMLLRDYDVLLFGQSLLDNLDSYPYWHSSQTQEQGDKQKLKLDAFNLSQYASFEADSLLARVRETSDMKSREKALKELNEILKRDVPAVFLYSPLYVFAYDDSISGIQPGSLALHSDRFLTLSNWYINTDRRFKEGKSWLSLPGWLLRLGR